jgi:hypothetical protein
MQRAVSLLVGLALTSDETLLTVKSDRYLGAKRHAELALGTFDADASTLDAHVNSAWDFYGQLSNPRHFSFHLFNVLSVLHTV